jgi:transposase-like protein
LARERRSWVKAFADDPRHRIVMKRSWAGEVRNVSLLVASAVNSEGFREILGICDGTKEDKSGWSAFLRHLVDRGLTGVQLIISDGLPRPDGKRG